MTDGYLASASDLNTVLTPLGDAITLNCPANVLETDAGLSCAVTLATGPSLCAIGAGDTCGGAIDGACVGPYTSAIVPDEAQGPGGCNVEVVKGPATSGVIGVIIDEVNQLDLSALVPRAANERQD